MFSRPSRAANSAVLSRISNSSETLWLSSVPTKMKKIRSKVKALEFSQHYPSFFSDAQGQVTLELVVVSGRNLNSSKISCISSLPARMKMIESKMKELEWSQHFYHYNSMGIFQDAQRQLTPQSLVRSGQISNSSEMLLISSLPASMKKIRSKIKALESSHFPHYYPIGAIRCHGNQSSNPIRHKTLYSIFPTSMMLQMKFCCDWPFGCRAIHV